MSLLAVPILAVLAFFLVIISSFIFYILFSRLQSQMQVVVKQIKANELFIYELRVDTDNLQTNLAAVINKNEQNTLASEQVSKQLEHRIKILQTHFNDQQKFINQWQENQGQDKFYSRAFKLAEKGADIEEIMLECELPRAEVEMLLSVYQQRVQN